MSNVQKRMWLVVAVKLVLEANFFNIHVEGDCFLVIKELAEGLKTLSYADNLLINAHRYLAYTTIGEYHLFVERKIV